MSTTIDERHLVVFTLAGEEYGVPIHSVREILRIPQISRVPQAPEHVRGVVNVRGQIVPVLELRTRLGLEPLEPGPRSRIIVVESERRPVGLLVDDASQVLRVPDAVVTGAEDAPVDAGSCIAGLAQLESRLIILLDLAATLRMQAVEEA
jgi:purine-binding chemotaxis protein CheW